MTLIKLLFFIFSDHLTSFALLLGGGFDGSGNSCENSFNATFSWISLGFIIAAIILIIIAVIINELRYVSKELKKQRTLISIQTHRTD